MGTWTLTSAILVQCSTSWTIMPTGSWSLRDKPAHDGYTCIYIHDTNKIINESNYLFIGKDYKDCFFKFIFLWNMKAEMFWKQENFAKPVLILKKDLCYLQHSDQLLLWDAYPLLVNAIYHIYYCICVGIVTSPVWSVKKIPSIS